jgi:hypothetical protein
MDKMLGMLLITANSSLPVTPKTEVNGGLASKLSKKWKGFLQGI